MKFDLRRALALLFTSVWWATLLGVAVFKIYRVQDGLYEYAIHFTNWSWTIQFSFYTLDLVSYSDSSFRFKSCSLLLYFFVAWGTAWLVYFLVYLLIGLNPAIFENNIDDYGTSVVLLADRVFHNLPIAANFAYVIINYAQLVLAFAWLREAINGNYCLMAAYTLVYSILPAGLLLLYHLTLDITKVYAIETSFEAGYVLLIVVTVLFVALPIAWLFFKSQPPKIRDETPSRSKLN